MELSILKDIVIIFALSTLVNLIFTRFRIPTVVGYLAYRCNCRTTSCFHLISEGHQIELLAEIGVVLLLFTIGMEFSLQHLLKIRRIVFLGGLIQVTVTAGAVFHCITFFRDELAGRIIYRFSGCTEQLCAGFENPSGTIGTYFKLWTNSFRYSYISRTFCSLLSSCSVNLLAENSHWTSKRS